MTDKNSAFDIDRNHLGDEDFITHTIASVDQMLDAQRQDEINAAIEEQNQIIDAEREREWDEYWGKWCQVHDIELVNGQCAACVSEEADERRNDL